MRAPQARQRATDSVIPDGEEIRRRRMMLGMSQTDFIHKVLKTQWDERFLRKLEAGRDPCERSTLELVAKALTAYGQGVGPCSVADITKGASQFSLAMLDESVASTESEIGHKTGALARVLHAVNSSKSPEVAVVELLLALAVRRDVLGDVEGAIRIGDLLVAEASAYDRELRVRVLVRAASFYDHIGQPRLGLRLLRPVVAEAESARRTSSAQWWALFQYGTLESRSGRNASAEERLNRVRRYAPHRAHRVAARHQLGVIDLKLGRYDEAEKKFASCLRSRLLNSNSDFRVVYEHRRLSEVFEKRGDREMAQYHLREADRIAYRYQFKRYRSHLPPLRRARRRTR